MNRTPTPPQGTVTSLRAPQKTLFVGRKGPEYAAQCALFIEEHYLPYLAEDADAALTRLRKEKFYLVVVEAEAPGLDGAAFVQALRADPSLNDLPILARSTSDDMAAIERCLASGADDYLPKQYGAALLRVRLNAAVDRHRLQDNAAMRSEMRVARHIQRDFLPETLPSVRGLELHAALHPAKQVSGDFYDAFQIAPSGQLFFVVGDVCDKGVGAALFMALFRSLIRASADPEGGGAIQMLGGRRTLVQQTLEAATPADLLLRVAGFTNNYIARLHGRTNMFATVFMAMIDPVYGSFTYLNAGHEPALVLGSDGIVQELRPTGPALGMMPDMSFSAVEGTLGEGQTLFAFTDGLAEARSPSGKVFGGERLRELVRGAAGESATGLVGLVVETLREFGQQGEPHDDLTLLAATRL